VEYSLIIGGIAAVIIVVVYALGVKVNKLYNTAIWP
jgi:Flp pilus assembly pilin Flp